MVKILIVDDNGDKVRRVLEVIREVPGLDVKDVEVAYTGHDARRYLAKEIYDLLILDIALPDHADTQPAPEGGIALFKEVCERPQLNKPKHIVGLTAYPEALLQASPPFDRELWRVIQYDPGTLEWVEQLKRKLRYLALATAATLPPEHGSDLCVMTALQSPEFSALLDLPWNWKVLDTPSEASVFHEGSFDHAGSTFRVIAGCAARTGMIAAAIMANKLIYNFRPRFLAMTGIAAGIRGSCNIGDVLVGDPIWDYGNGKWSVKGSKTLFEIAPHQVALDPALRARFQLMAQDYGVSDAIRSAWPGPKPDSALKIIVCPLGSGASVRADGRVAKEIKAQHRQAVGIEMEAYGVMAAAHDAPLPEVRGFVLKSVSDFADATKSDDYQAYASYTSAAILKVFAESFLPI
jgi:nucleoside phosphorylase/CheY-like chemotaxis protein